MLRTPICEKLGIEYPIISAGMGGIALARLVAAVSNAGGLGVLGGNTLTSDELRTEIQKVRELTSRPFGVDLLMPVGLPQTTATVRPPDLPPFLAELQQETADLPD